MKGVRDTARREVGVPPCPPPMHYVVCWGSWLDSMCAPRDAGINPQLLGCKQVLVPPNQPFGVCPSPPPPKASAERGHCSPRCPRVPPAAGHPPLSHQRDVDAVGSSHGRERHVAPDDGRQVLGEEQGAGHREALGTQLPVPKHPEHPYLGEGLEPQRCHNSPAGRAHVGRPQLAAKAGGDTHVPSPHGRMAQHAGETHLGVMGASPLRLV